MYLVPYQKDFVKALRYLQARELDEGRFSYPCSDANGERVFERPFWPTPAPGSLKEAIELADAVESGRPWRSRVKDPKRPRVLSAARDAGDADGTRSILDIQGIVKNSEEMFANLLVLDSKELRQYLGTDRPSRQTLAEYQRPGWPHIIDRGQGVAFVVYRNDKPSEICFTGCSFD